MCPKNCAEKLSNFPLNYKIPLWNNLPSLIDSPNFSLGWVKKPPLRFEPVIKDLPHPGNKLSNLNKY